MTKKSPNNQVIIQHDNQVKKHLETEYRIDYEFNSGSTKVLFIKIQKKIWPGEWEDVKRESYTGEEQERQFEAVVKRLN